jgi:hypothetical protein
MKAFTIDAENNITIYPSFSVADKAVKAAIKEGTAIREFGSEQQLAGALADKTGAELAEIFNAFTGVTPVKKFMDRKAAAKRIWRECEKMTIAEAQPEAEPEAPAAKPAKAKRAKAPKRIDGMDTAPRLLADGSLTTEARAPRETSKTAQLIALLKTEAGMTLDAICATFGWQAHTTRALMSAGGALAKKHGHTVISEKVGEARTYRIAS